MLRNSVLGICVLGAAVMTTSACSDAGQSLFILQNQIPTENSDGSCSVSPMRTNLFSPSGALDVSVPGGYDMFPLVQNVATAPGSADESVRVAIVRGADVELRFQGGFLDGLSEAVRNEVEIQSKTSVLFTGPVSPTGGLTAFIFSALSPQFVRLLGGADFDSKFAQSNRTVVEAQIRIFGVMDGSPVESEKFVYPIEIGKGNLLNVIGPCDQLLPEVPIQQGFQCSSGLQDRVIDCCQQPGNAGLVCPAVAPMM